jgi:hypothetical protein
MEPLYTAKHSMAVGESIHQPDFLEERESHLFSRILGYPHDWLAAVERLSLDLLH